ncbi:MAG: hypothetical protein HQL41_05955 [Alphaproteobacteria bacterium]|nr:hypothetical protein [Alphaproteobacteria bacterium]
MPVAITFKMDDRSVRIALQELPGQARFATVLALTRVAKKAQAASQDEMRRVFDRPTPYTMRSLAVRPATKTDLEAEVLFRDFAGKGTPARKYMFPGVYGGARHLKRFERALAARDILPSGMMAMPGEGAKLDAYGNMSRGQIVKILSYLKASSDPTQNRGANASRGTRRKDRYFVGGVGRAKHFHPGIYMGGKKVTPVLSFGNEAGYRPIFAFHDIVRRTVEASFDECFAEALRHALATARP